MERFASWAGKRYFQHSVMIHDNLRWESFLWRCVESVAMDICICAMLYEVGQLVC